MQSEYLEPKGVAAPDEPYSHAIRAGDTLYIAGQVAVDENNQFVGEGDPRLQAEQVWRNIEAATRSAGGSVTNVVKITIFLKDIRHATAEIEVRKRLFPDGRYPICTQVQVANLARPQLLMEIDAIAVL
jgi:3-hydroxyisobutyrate dehydrogenase